MRYRVKEYEEKNDRYIEQDTKVPILDSRDDAVAMCRAMKIMEGGNYFVEEVEPEKFDIAAEKLGVSSWEVMRRIRTVGPEGMRKLIALLDTEYAPMAALGFVAVTRIWSVDYMAAVSLLKSIVVGGGSSGERALAYLLLYFYNEGLARRLGSDFDPLSAYRLLDVNLQATVKPLFIARLEEKESW